ncbi:MAG: PAS domain S-box protein [Desulfopila sp.]
MKVKPTYEELERRIQELEKIESEYKYSKDALRESESLFKMLYEKAPLGYQSLDENGHFIVVNQTWLDTLGYNREEVLGKSFADFLHPDWQDHFKKNFPRFTSIGEVLGVEFEMVKKNGSLILVSFTGKISKDETGNFQQTHCIFFDITERRKHEELLERYKNIVSSTTDAIAYLDENYRYIIVNNAYEDFSGAKRDDFVGMTVTEYLGKDIFEEKIKSNLDKCLNGEIINYQEWFKFPTKGKRFVDVTYFPYRDGKNPISGVIANTRDITDRKQAEEVLKLNYSLLQIAGETAIFGGWSVDLEKNICTWSDAVADIHDVPHGYSPPVQEAINFYAPEWREKITQCFSACVKEGHSYDEEMEIITQKGKHVWVRTTGKAVKNETGKIVKVQGSFQDITDKKQAEEALRESEEKLQSLFSAMTDMVVLHEFLFDDNGMPCNYRILDCNQAFCRITKIKKETAVGKTATQVYNTDSAPYMDVYAKVALSGEPVQFVAYYASMDKHFLVSVVSPRKNFFATITSDITEIRRAEAEREKLQAQLNQAQKMESVGRLAGGVAHDFNNMLGVILGHTEMALEEIDPTSPLYASLQAVQHAGERSADLTRQLLAFARKQTIAPRVIDINETVEGMLNILRRLIGEDIDLLWQPGINLQPVKVDPSQIDQLLANLCVNARDAIDGVGKITIETDAKTFDEDYCTDHLGALPGDYVMLEVSDVGCGMDKKTLSHIFEPFFTTKEQGQGTGLGLASVFGMVKQNNGFINVYSEPGQGTTIKIYLPAYAVKSDEMVEKAPELSTERGNETILLVEDESAILEITTMMLERLGYSVVAAATPSEAIRLAQEHRGRIDLLMTDVVMPEMNGRELAGNLRSHCPNLKGLFMSGYTANVIAHHGVLDEGVHFIQKPFSMKDLGRKLREALED